MGVIAFLFGVFAIVGGHTDSSHSIIAYAAGGMFCLVGVFIMTYRPGQNRFGRFLGIIISLVMLGIFHWLAFGGIGKVEPVASVIVSVIDLVIVVVAAKWLFNRMKVKAPGL